MNLPHFAYETVQGGLGNAGHVIAATRQQGDQDKGRHAAPRVESIAFIDYGGIPYAAICRHLMAQRWPGLNIAKPVSLDRSNRRFIDRCTSNLRLHQAGLPWGALLGRVPLDSAALCTLDLLVAVDLRTEQALAASLPAQRPPIHQLTKWPAYRMPMHHRSLAEAILADLESRLEVLLGTLTRQPAGN